MNGFPLRTKHCQKREGMALVVSLALIVLMTAVVLAFFARATANRVVETSRANRIGAEQLAQTARDYIAAEFLREIATNSVSSTSNNMVVCQPLSNSFAVPQRPLPVSLASDTNFSNLLRRSVNETTNGIGETNASSDSTAAAAKNGRTVSASRWNAPRLLTGGGFTDTSQLPHWIYVNQDGTVTGTPNANVIGRFAYNVYDTGGLLDANVAGHISEISGTNLSILNGTPAKADLSVIPGMTNADVFIRWRNANSADSASSYVTAMTNAATNGFLFAANGDQRITSRQDLLNLARNGSLGISTNALPYLTHFSRAINAPSWTPPQNASVMPDYSASLASNTRNYKTDAEKASSVNRNIPNVRVTKSFTRRDGSTAQKGDPLIKQRFPLAKLALVKDGATDSDIQSYFGLTWNAGADGWNYRSDTIASLDQVATAGREPDFFELLKAGILDGSLGKTTATDTGIQNKVVDANVDLQIFTIGANLIDQADADDQPTHIVRSITSEDVFGIENHPYIYLMSQTHFRRHDMDYDPSNTANPAPWVTAYQQFQVWNPNLNATGHQGRTYRIRAIQGISRAKTLRSSPTPSAWQSSLPVDQTSLFISFSGTPTFANPVLLTPDNISSASPVNTLTTLGASLVGFHLGDCRAPNNADEDNNWNNDYAQATVSFDIPIVYQLEYSDEGNWKPIQRMYPLSGGMGHGMGTTLLSSLLPNYGGYNLMNVTANIYSGRRDMVLTWCKSDSRSQRFGVYQAAYSLNNLTMRPGTTSYYNAWQYSVTGPGWKITYPLPVISNPMSGYTPGDLADNRVNSPSYVADPDGVVRPADGTRSTNILGTGSQARPVILNRPLESIGEMAYAMRGDPWKSLDFASAGSADSALLDLFSINEISSIQAGTVNPNKAPKEVLQSLLLNTETDPVISTNSLTSANAADIATKIRNYVDTNAIANRADLVRMAEELTIGGTYRDQPVIPGLDHKRQREVIIRALAGACNTRTWNLMVDIVAQAGSFPANSTSPGTFIVKGEQRLWAHLAIDRPTEKIISQFSEICPE